MNQKDFFEQSNIRFCDRCSGFMKEGYTNMEGDIHVCNNCFSEYMNKRYGKNNWRQTEDDGCEGFYQVMEGGKWYGTGIFWTEWE